MKFHQLILCILISLNQICAAYETPTHDEISRQTIISSILATDVSLYEDLGLDINAETPAFPSQLPNSIDNPTPANPILVPEASIVRIIAGGSVLEDAGANSAHHFYDPFRDRPIKPIGTHRSVLWITEINEDGERVDLFQQSFSYSDAIGYFYNALTKKQEADRNIAFGRMFRSIGHVIHHIQDMAQPQHVRHDAHCDAFASTLAFVSCGATGQHNPSLYESYTRGVSDEKLRFDIDYAGGTGVNFDRVRDFWATDPGLDNFQSEGRGMAEFTNMNFVSQRTNFNLDENDQPGLNLEFPLPTPIVDGDEPRIETKQLRDLSVVKPENLAKLSCDDPTADCPVDFYQTRITDNYLGNFTEINERASSLSIFDKHLESRLKKKSFTLNEANFDSGYQFLIPRAVAYGAGLIKHFFRGRLEVEEATIQNGKIVIKIKNVSSPVQTLWGDVKAFELHYDSLSGERKLADEVTITEGQLPLAVGDTLKLSVNLPDDVDNDIEKPYMLIFKATEDENFIGQESGIAAINFVPEEGSGTGNSYFIPLGGSFEDITNSLGACEAFITPLFDAAAAAEIAQAEGTGPNGWDAELTQDLTKIASSHFFDQPSVGGNSALHSERHNYQGIVTRFFKINGVRNGQTDTSEWIYYCTENTCVDPGLPCNYDVLYGG